MTLCRRGYYTRGAGNANRVCNTDRRQRHFKEVFKCGMIGTFNIKINASVYNDELGQPCKTGKEGVIFNYWLVKITNSAKKVYYAYMLRWEGSNMRLDNLELVSKQKIPSEFKSGTLKIDIFTQWDKHKIKAWLEEIDRKDRFQGHPHDPTKRSDSAYVWGHFKNLGLSGKKVLDIGCNTGYYSFRASEQGASVIAVDINRRALSVAQTIQQHIEMTDVQFYHTKQLNWQNLDKNVHFDYIFYLSVHHQLSPDYKKLREMLKYLKGHCNVLCAELINPPLDTSVYKKKDEIDNIVKAEGGKLLSYYKHKVRKHRSIYLITSR